MLFGLLDDRPFRSDLVLEVRKNLENGGLSLGGSLVRDK